MSETNISVTTKNISNLLKEFTPEDRYRIIFATFLEDVLQENAKEFFEKNIIGIHKQKIVEMFLDYNNLIDDIDFKAYDFIKHAIEKHPEYFIEVSS